MGTPLFMQTGSSNELPVLHWSFRNAVAGTCDGVRRRAGIAARSPCTAGQVAILSAGGRFDSQLRSVSALRLLAAGALPCRGRVRRALPPAHAGTPRQDDVPYHGSWRIRGAHAHAIRSRRALRPSFCRPVRRHRKAPGSRLCATKQPDVCNQAAAGGSRRRMPAPRESEAQRLPGAGRRGTALREFGERREWHRARGLLYIHTNTCGPRHRDRCL